MPSDSRHGDSRHSDSRHSDSLLRAFLDEGLPPEQMAEIEEALRSDHQLHERLARLRGMQDAGMHSIGAIWRRHRISCPDRSQLGQYLLGVLDPEVEAYVRFHVERIGCRYCSANLSDLQRERSESATQVETRRRRYYQTSAGYLHRDRASD
jgi:hypothetical protein